MARVIEMPPKLTCPRCAVPLRPATRDELRADPLDPQYRHIAEQAAQGARDFEPPADSYAAMLAADPRMIERPSWLLRCDSCGLRMMHCISEEQL
jgi:hypothetical protein